MTEWETDVVDSPVKWVADHIRRYVESDGKAGHRWSGVNTLLITTRGRKTGLLRRTALIYGRDDDNYVVVASAGGRDEHPHWYQNLVANPEVHVRVKAHKLVARARAAEGAERARLWELMVAIWPDYENYQQRTSRRIPVVILEPV